MKAIAVYIDHRGSELAIAENYAIFIRFQEKNCYGYFWTKWMICGNSEGLIPITIDVGFGIARKQSGTYKYRLPNDTNIIKAKIKINKKDFDIDYPFYNDN